MRATTRPRHYSPLAGIDASNVSRLAVAWEWAPAEQPRQEFGTQPGNFQNTPLMSDDVLYVSTMYNRVAALDAETGKELWSYDPKAYEDGQPPNGTGFVHRGVDRVAPFDWLRAGANLSQQPLAPYRARRQDRRAGERASATRAWSISRRACVVTSIASTTRTPRRPSSIAISSSSGTASAIG
jgi:hypothetical protein